MKVSVGMAGVGVWRTQSRGGDSKAVGDSMSPPPPSGERRSSRCLGDGGGTCKQRRDGVGPRTCHKWLDLQQGMGDLQGQKKWKDFSSGRAELTVNPVSCTFCLFKKQLGEVNSDPPLMGLMGLQE